jgi:hypothetical protein
MFKGSGISRTVASSHTIADIFQINLKVVGNEKEGGPGKWQMIDIYLGLW